MKFSEHFWNTLRQETCGAGTEWHAWNFSLKWYLTSDYMAFPLSPQGELPLWYQALFSSFIKPIISSELLCVWEGTQRLQHGCIQANRHQRSHITWFSIRLGMRRASEGTLTTDQSIHTALLYNSTRALLLPLHSVPDLRTADLRSILLIEWSTRCTF